MKKISILIICFHGLICFSQNSHEAKFDTIREPGYLILKRDNISKGSDTPMEYLFIPCSKMKNDFKNSYVSNIKPSNNEIYLTAPLLKDISGLSILNVAISKILKSSYQFKIKEISSDEFLAEPKTFFTYENHLYQVFFLDALWVKTEIDKKNIDLFGVHYNLQMLNPNSKRYVVNFLIDIKAYSSELFEEIKSFR